MSGRVRAWGGMSRVNEWWHSGESSPDEGFAVLIDKSQFDSRRSKGPGLTQVRECRRNEGRRWEKGVRRTVQGHGRRIELHGTARSSGGRGITL